MFQLRPPQISIMSQFPAARRPRVRRRFPLPAGVPTGFIETPEWIKVACQEEANDIHEFRGLDDNNPRILEYIATVPRLAHINYRYGDKKHPKKTIDSGRKMSEVDETAWCACFVNWCLTKAKMNAPGFARAERWAKYGTRVDPKDVKLGAIAVIYHKPIAAMANMTQSGWHVGFYIGGPVDQPVLLGGNQSDMVCRKQIKGAETIDYRWPVETSPAKK
jgi:uncharacterized protein (TIGR02594 family)